MIATTLFAMLVTTSAARAQPASPATASTDRVWRYVAVPFIAGNSNDGLGAGAGAEIIRRPLGEETGYDLKIKPYAWSTFSLSYQSLRLSVEQRRVDVSMTGQVGFRHQSNQLYAGSGGVDISSDWGDRAAGNLMVGPYAFLSATRPLGVSRWRVYIQGYLRAVRVRADKGGLLDERRPLGAEGSGYGDVSIGLFTERTDRWPVPERGWVMELDARVGATAPWRDSIQPLVGAHASATRWTPLGTRRFVLGSRLLFEHSLGERPFFEQSITGGRFREALGAGKALAGYPSIARGDGVLAAMVELRLDPFPPVGKGATRVMFSAFAEEGFLFDDFDIGPDLPTLGGGPSLYLLDAIVVRPWFAFGWSTFPSLAPDGRSPGLSLGLSFADPL